MKKIMFYLVVALCFSMNQMAIAQSNSAITTDELKALYDNGEYKKAQSYAEDFINKKNATALIILGDCFWEDSKANEEQINKIYQQSSISHIMAMSQGIYYDNSFSDMIYQQAQQEIIRQRLKAIDLYSKAAQLGNNTGNRRMVSINTSLGNNTNSNTAGYNNSGSGSGGNTNNNVVCYTCHGMRACKVCKGSGVTSMYGQSSSQCTACNGTGKCWHCNGTGRQ
jgi:hypothetical protein